MVISTEGFEFKRDQCGLNLVKSLPHKGHRSLSSEGWRGTWSEAAKNRFVETRQTPSMWRGKRAWWAQGTMSSRKNKMAEPDTADLGNPMERARCS